MNGRVSLGIMTSAGTEKSILKTKRRRGIYEVMATKTKSWKSSRSLLTNEHYDMMSPNIATFANIDAPPSMFPTKKYCDITGLPSKYMDPVTKLRYESKEVFRMVRRLHDHKVEEFLSLRQAQTRLK